MENIIMISLSRWDSPFSSAAFSLAKELSKNHQIFYVDNPFTLKDFIINFRTDQIALRKNALLMGRNIYRKFPDLPSTFVAVTPRLTIPINTLPPGKMYDYSLKFNNWIVSTTIKNIISDFNLTDYIFFNSFNPFFDDILPAGYSPKYRIYQSRDDISESEYVSRHGPRIEREAISRADFSFATSKNLCKILSTDKINVRYLPNAADISIFKKALEPIEKPKELQGVEQQIIGYTGAIGLREDYELIKKIAETFHDKKLLLVGPRGEKKYTRINFDQYPNILFTGAKNINELPNYLRYIDCAIIPFKCNKLTFSIYPLKVNEYLAAGKSVVSTKFSEDIAEFNEVIYLAGDHNEFLQYIKSVLDKGPEKELVEKRIKFAESNTWESRVASFWQVVNGVSDQVNKQI